MRQRFKNLIADSSPRRPPKMGRSPLEDVECIHLVNWMTAQMWRGIRFAHVANENKATSRRAAINLGKKRKRLGVSPGFPDYIVAIEPREGRPGSIHFVEMKRRDGVPSDVSEKQREWIAAFNTLGIPGVHATVANGFEEAVDYIKGFL